MHYKSLAVADPVELTFGLAPKPVRIGEATVADYAEGMIHGDPFPSVAVFPENGDFLLVGGFHRVRAARKARFNIYAAEFRHGRRSDALKYSHCANHAHGLRRTNEDKRHAVTLALDAQCNPPPRIIARCENQLCPRKESGPDL